MPSLSITLQRTPKLHIQLMLQYFLAFFLFCFNHHSRSVVFWANCVSWMLKHERGILFGGSIEIMNKKPLEIVTTKHSILITTDSLGTELQTQHQLFRLH